MLQYNDWVSMPLWCNYEKQLLVTTSGLTRVSMPLWCNYEQNKRQPRNLANSVSMPLWCNYENAKMRVNLISIVCFNATMVQL